jgi:tetratricopeptide (TPR) repeat protein
MRPIVAAAALLLAAGVAKTMPAQELGTITFPTSGAPAAQPEFIRGVLFLHSFEYASAAEAFRRAQALDPKFAMAYWGEALTYTHQVWNQQDVGKARAALQRLAPTRDARLAAAPTPRERAYLSAVETLYGDGPKARRDTLYANAMEQVSREWPKDDEAALLYATALLGLSQGVRDVPLYMRAGAIAQDVFRRNPRHPGAAHMIIHAFDDPVHAPLGLYAARQYSQIAPSAAHAQHMTTHIFLALGMWREVVSQNIVASGPDTSKWGPGHYTSWLLYGYLQQGRFEDARRLLASLSAHAARRPAARGVVANLAARYVAETERWDSPEARALDGSLGAEGEDGYEYATFVAGYAAAKRGDHARAAALLARLATTNGNASVTVKPGASGSVVVPVILELSLRAELERQSGHLDSAVALLRRATALEDGMPAEFGPPAVVMPSHELLGGLLFTAGKLDDAAMQYTRALQLQPGRSTALLATARIETARGRKDAALHAYRQLADNWNQADAGIDGLTEARSRVVERPRP